MRLIKTNLKVFFFLSEYYEDLEGLLLRCEVDSNGIRRYQCFKCGVYHKYKQNLKRHILKECGIGERLFVCEYCDWRFKRNFDLKRHISAKHLDKNSI